MNIRRIIAELTDEQFRLAVIVIGAILLLPLIGGLLTPEIRKRTVLVSALRELGISEQDIARQKQTMGQIDAEVRRLLAIHEKDPTAMPRDLVDAAVIGGVEELALKTGLLLRGVRPGIGVPADHFEELVYNVSLEGGYLSLRQWLSGIREVLPGVIVKNCDLQPLSGNNVLVAELSLAMYRSDL